MFKRSHLPRLLRNNSSGWWIPRQNNLVAIIVWIHALCHDLPNQSTTNPSSTSCRLIYLGVKHVQEGVPSALTVSRVFLWFPEFGENQRLLQNHPWVRPVSCQPFLHKRHLQVVVLSREPKPRNFFQCGAHGQDKRFLLSPLVRVINRMFKWINKDNHTRCQDMHGWLWNRFP